ncbi:MAG TPA: NAD(P)H-dependent glycerol-3-phosphate dehydrogenase [Gemmatimonadaceae bacterium]|nr:NAD(P)H-dependent glycerol-3-phosphate dehydrogenase [Gemmatimonadaceae bacterium]
MRCAVIGAGAWGTALANLLASNGHGVRLWALEPEVVANINARHENGFFLAGAPLEAAVVATGDQSEALAHADLVIYATPSNHLRSIARAGGTCIAADTPVVVASKGIERTTLALMSEVIEDEVPGRAVVALSGPSFAAEVAAREPTAVVAASPRADAAARVQEALSNASFRVYTHDDLIGVELGGALKNVMAVATGILEGVGLGFNARAALITRGLAEMTRLGTALGARASTFAGLAGIGDLVLTCTGSLSRNRALGVEVGRGRTLDEALAGKQTVAEGVPTTASTVRLAQRLRVEMPIATMVHRILFENLPARSAARELMARELRAEQDA